MSPGAEEYSHPGEIRLPAALAVVAAIALYALLPEKLIVGPRFVIPALEALLFVPVLAVNPRRLTRKDRRFRTMSIVVLLLIACTNAVALVELVLQLVDGSKQQGKALLTSAAQVWLTNILVFALGFWELDRGGPVTRTQVPRDQLPTADFRFPQDEDHDAVREVARRSSRASDWRPGFVDYLYVSVTNSSAFSPTDTMPLSWRAKLMMAVQSVSAILLSVLVIARGVSLLQ
ncbi:uncharacterized protein DUF1345 [Motilibacter rhizosphaerae]|uniref:Uncharacterized protein DUF1345 n=1 Tax=Motilibacter rhizosphaerae TaxID=598652 RepID=A0A4Q7NRJ4_9ACTN|nr:uncharacterized protein DUF1345 [Motilibacter rhizosphaerae]